MSGRGSSSSIVLNAKPVACILTKRYTSLATCFLPFCTMNLRLRTNFSPPRSSLGLPDDRMIWLIRVCPFSVMLVLKQIKPGAPFIPGRSLDATDAQNANKKACISRTVNTALKADIITRQPKGGNLSSKTPQSSLMFAFDGADTKAWNVACPESTETSRSPYL